MFESQYFGFWVSLDPQMDKVVSMNDHSTKSLHSDKALQVNSKDYFVQKYVHPPRADSSHWTTKEN